MRLIAPFLLLLPVLAFAQRQSFVITGKVEGIPTGAVVFLTDANNPTDTLSQDHPKDGKFTLSGKINEPNLYYLNFGTQKKDLLFIGNDEVNISGSVSDIKTLRISGSPSNQDFEL